MKLVFSRVYQIINSQIKTLSEKLGPDVAAAFGLAEDAVPRVQELMSVDVLRALSGIKREIHEYLDSVETEAVSDKARPPRKKQGRPSAGPRAGKREVRPRKPSAGNNRRRK